MDNQKTIPYLNILLNIRYYTLICSKLFAILLCLYYIKHAQQYQVTWGIINYIIPQGLINILSSIGIYVLIVPTTILIVSSLLFPNITLLNLISSFLGISTVLYAALKSNSIFDGFNFRFLTVIKNLTLDEKRALFKEYYTTIIQEKYEKLHQIYQYLVNKLSDVNFLDYDNVLNNLTTPIQIKSYTESVIAHHVETLNNLNAYKITSEVIPKILWITGGIVGVFLLLYAVSLMTTPALELLSKTIDVMKESTKTLQTTATGASEALEVGAALAKEAVNTNGMLSALNINYDQLISWLRLLTQKVEILEKLFKP